MNNAGYSQLQSSLNKRQTSQVFVETVEQGLNSHDTYTAENLVSCQDYNS